tara:strand:- start:334 stop:606 length:273 start_codon:yes stop_codon:yes gene_type:complete
MNDQIDVAKHPFGLGGGTIISGAAQISGEWFIYYPLQTSIASLKLPNLENGSNLSSTFLAGIPIYGAITEVTQSSGLAILYSGSQQPNRY